MLLIWLSKFNWLLIHEIATGIPQNCNILYFLGVRVLWIWTSVVALAIGAVSTEIYRRKIRFPRVSHCPWDIFMLSNKLQLGPSELVETKSFVVFFSGYTYIYVSAITTNCNQTVHWYICIQKNVESFLFYAFCSDKNFDSGSFIKEIYSSGMPRLHFCPSFLDTIIKVRSFLPSVQLFIIQFVVKLYLIYCFYFLLGSAYFSI